MSASDEPLKIAIVGFGPRGLGALEALATQFVGGAEAVQVDIYDPMRWTATGPNYDPEQVDLCLLNIPARSVEYKLPAFMASHFKGFLGWALGRYEPDDFPPRSEIGAYLYERFVALKRAAANTIAISQSNLMITEVEQKAQRWWLSAENMSLGPYDEVLLSQGQPATSSDTQLAQWISHAAEHDLPLISAYPTNELAKAAKDWSGKTVAVRGMGLSTLDVIRVLTRGMGGTYVGKEYRASGREPLKLCPFSLNGKPPVAKPATQKLDRRFDLSNAEEGVLVAALQDCKHSGPDIVLTRICNAMVPPILRVLSELGENVSQADVETWLEIERTDPNLHDRQGSIGDLEADIQMAYGRSPPDIGYVAGQVWRKLQDTLKCCFNQGQFLDETAIAIIEFDEAFKRYSYGPPVVAVEELLVLIDHGIVSLCMVDDPAVVLDQNGWQLLEGDDVIIADVLVDAVLPAPSLESVIDPLVVAGKVKGQMKPRYAQFGAHTLTDGQLVDVSGDVALGLSMLGRLSLGSVIAVDGLSDCFGASTSRWAKGVVGRHQTRVASV